MKQKTQHTITNDNNNDNKVKIFSRVKISFCRKDTHTTKRIWGRWTKTMARKMFQV